ncbi:lipopolysaccharide transport system ATP-binding protein [Bosea sp. OK403]|uniref:ABC transporter ATP-binding protein n=1 Tax=Bosea sp. OK403 TaxID=1855286 RepID=UPI0008EE9B82|nr:ABC transporter ATP-binding protein [Bosea sp. OK403]SFI89877.1 lipopolysaccharide transport system ATP-binding protein [Bosea sp. OK403]
MSSDITVAVNGVSKGFRTYARPEDRLKQALMPRLARLLGRSVHRYFREFWALRDVTFSIRKGETVGIIGRNGAGKSTLLQIICGTLAPTTGTVQTSGRVAALLELGAGFNPEFTGRENVYLNGSLLGLSTAEINARLPQIEAFADIGDFIDQPVKTYSSGMTVRLAFAVIAHVDAEILIIDEALAVGDALFVQKCMRFLRGFAERGTLLFVSHDTAAVLSLCDRAIWLDGGTIVEDGVPKVVSESYLVRMHSAVQGLDLNLTRVSTIPPETPPPSDHDADADADNVVVPAQGTSSFGAGGAEINQVTMANEAGRAIRSVEGGEEVTLAVRVRVQAPLANPILGFYVRDRLGQNLFGENTFLTYQGSDLGAAPGEILQASFHFRMPYLVHGDYSICVGVADGTPEVHAQHHFINDVLIFRSLQKNGHRGLLGLTDMRVRFERTI